MISTKYRPGVHNADADALSRLPAVHKSQTAPHDRHHIGAETVRAVCSSLLPESYVECLTLSAKGIEDNFSTAGQSSEKLTDEELGRW